MGCINTKVVVPEPHSRHYREVITYTNNLHWQTAITKMIGERCMILAKIVEPEAHDVMRESFANLSKVIPSNDPAFLEATRLMEFIEFPVDLYNETISSAMQYALSNDTSTFNKVFRIISHVIRTGANTVVI